MILVKKEAVEFVLEDERELPKADQTIFVIKELGSMDRARFVDEANAEGVGAIESSILYTQRSIIDIKNLKDADGKEIKFDATPRGGYVSREMIDMFPSEVLNELAVFTAELGGLIESEKK